jgi:hypothetical protein
MKFEKWVKSQGGTTHVAAKLGVTSMAVQQWLLAKASPRALTIQKLILMSKGKLSFDDIIHATKKGVKR